MRNHRENGPAHDGAAPAPAPPQGTGTGGDRSGAAPAAGARRLKARLLFAAVAQPFDGVARPVWNRLPRRWRFRLWAGAVLAAMLASNFAATAQGPPAGPPPDGPAEAEEFLPNPDLAQTNDASRVRDHSRSNDLAPANGLVETTRAVPTNGLPPGARSEPSAQSDVPSRADHAAPPAPPAGSVPEAPLPTGEVAATNGPSAADHGPAPLDYAAFKVIADRNIFDPNRVPHRPGAPRAKPKVTESFALVGTLSYEKGAFAFFDGSSAEFQKALKAEDSIAGYTVAAVAPNDVKLTSGTNTVALRIGMQMRREDGGDWLLATQSEPYAASAPASATNGAAPETATAQTGASSGGDLSEIEKRMMQRREQQ